MRSYQTVFNRQAADFVAASDDETLAEIELWVNRIERAPSTLGDYTEIDGNGRELQVGVLHRVVMVYWTDHGAREVRVARIEPHQDH